MKGLLIMSDQKVNKFGTFKGVFLPSILTILGVIMYLRMGWVVGNAGLAGTLIIVSLSSLITFLTGLSISAIATNMEVKEGGAYYMISRSFGAEAGSAIGIPLYLAQVVGIAFYIVGFTESVQHLLPSVPFHAIAVGSLVFLTLLAYISANLALRAQVLVLIVIILSLFSLFLGQLPGLEQHVQPAALPPAQSFWKVFAVFFPAVTGILSGLSLSGDLKNPRRSLPRGTIAAVLTGYAVYLAIPIFLYTHVPTAVLRTNLMISYDVALFGELILLGIWGATLSSALSSLLGAPRTLQALAKDKIVPSFLGKTFGPSENPRVAVAFSFLVALASVLLGDLDSIAPILTMFLLVTYGTLNLTASIEAFMNNPSWRPVFRISWLVPFMGFLFCLAVMIMISPSATIIAALITGALFYITSRRRMNLRWDDMRHGLLLSLARFSVYRLALFKPNAKSWRPTILVLSGAPKQHMNLIQLADTMTHGKGFLTVATVIKQGETSPERRESLEESARQYLADRHIPALIEINEASDFYTGARELIRTYGMGPLVPNTILLGTTAKPDQYVAHAAMIQHLFANRKNCILFRQGDTDIQKSFGQKNILCWWRGKENNAGLMLTLSYMLQTSPEWRGANLYIKTIVPSQETKEPMQQYMDTFLSTSRLIASSSILVESEMTGNAGDIIIQQSESADLVLLGLRAPGPEESAADYAAYYEAFLRRIAPLPPTMIVLAGEAIPFKDIFQ